MAIVYEDEPCEFLRPGEEFEIVGYFELLRTLGVRDATQEVKHSAIASWLERNAPGRLLADELVDKGYDVPNRRIAEIR